MRCELSEEELWNGLDSGAPDVAEHLARCPTCRSRAAEFRQGIAAVVTASTPTAPPLPESIGPYAIKRRLGEGGMGIVYEGEQSNPQRPVAIKVVRGGHTADDFRIRLLQREAQTLARLKHPSIAAIYEAGRTEGGQDYFAMELVRGVPLGEHVRQRKLPRPQRLVLFRRICEAINYAHQRGVIHRDIKPSNILIDSDGNPKILDFGLARIQDPESTLMTTVTDLGRLMGTLPYMSPEEARGSADEIDVRSDVYSLGIILYELLTDRLPYDVTGAALHEAVGIVCEQRPHRPGALDRSLRGDLETIVLKALAKERGRRYQSAAALAEDIARFLTDKPILGRRSSAVYQLRKFVARHRLFVLFAAASILLVSGARLWMVRLAAGDRQQIVRNIELLEIREASIEYQLATELHEAAKYVRAEPHYRNALATFLRLDQPERAGPALVELANLLLHHRDSTGDLELAEGFFLDALSIFDRFPVDFDVQRRRALAGLLKLYGPDVWDDTESFAKIQEETDLIEAAKNAPPRPPAK